MGRIVYGNLDLTKFPYKVMATGQDLSAGELRYSSVETLLTDGEYVLSDGSENRSLRLVVQIRDTDDRGSQIALAALAAEVQKPQNTLLYEANDDLGDATVLRTFEALMSRDADENKRHARIHEYTLDIPALPFGFAVSEIVDDAGSPPSQETGTVLYSAESTTGWESWDTVTNPPYTAAPSYSVDGTLYSEGAGSLKSRATYFDDDYFGGLALGWHKDKINGLSLDTDTGGYLAVDIRTDGQHNSINFRSGLRTLWMTTAEHGEQQITSFATIGRDSNDFVRYAWLVDAGLTVTGLRFEVYQYPTKGTGVRPFARYDNVQLLGATTTDKQIAKTLHVEGSARTFGSLRVSSSNEAIGLGRVLAITAPTDALPSGYTPDMRRWVTSGSAITDTGAPSGSYFYIENEYSDAAYFDAPASMFTPGPYAAVLSAEIQPIEIEQIGVRAQLLVDGVGVGPYSEVLLNNVDDIYAASEYHFMLMGVLDLPPTPVQAPSSDVKVRFEFKASALFALRVDNLYVIPVWRDSGRPVADFTIADCGTGTVEVGGASSSLWIDSPSVEQPQGGFWRGPDTTRVGAQAAWPEVSKPGRHAFRPGDLTAWVVSMNSPGPSVALAYTPAKLW